MMCEMQLIRSIRDHFSPYRKEIAAPDGAVFLSRGQQFSSFLESTLKKENNKLKNFWLLFSFCS